ncbi:hypothetical protein JCM10213_007790 [Rhodosporidiobolus nylandii]
MVAALSLLAAALVALSSAPDAVALPRPLPVFNSKHVDAAKVAAVPSATADAALFWTTTGSAFYLPGQAVVISPSSSATVESSSTSSFSTYNLVRTTPQPSPTFPSFAPLPPVTLAPSTTNSSAELFAELSALVSSGTLDPRSLAHEHAQRLNKRDTANLIEIYMSMVLSRQSSGEVPTPWTPGQLARASAVSRISASKASVTSSQRAASSSKAAASKAASSRTAALAASMNRATTTTKKKTTTHRASTTTSARKTTTTHAKTTARATTTSKKTITTKRASSTTKTTTSAKPTSTSTSSGLTDGVTFWKEKTYFYSLASFIQDVVDKANFSWGGNNVAVLKTGPPKSAWTGGKQRDTRPALQVAYPAGSRNPGKTPQGGVGFYSSKIDITAATNVTFSYSVFFPTGFDFVKGGKLPGLFGGKKACSGGAAAEDCFSTRLMYRKNGMGELYLYAPREKQVDALCELGPLSYCNSVYGMSIGRGSWTFKTGEWTDLRQDIWLNTPGKADGGFNIWVNDKLILHSNQVYYRNSAVGNIVRPVVGGSNSTSNDTVTLIDYDSIPDDVVIPNGGFKTLPSSSSGYDGNGTFEPSFVTKIIAPTPTSSATTSAAGSDDATSTYWAPDAEARRMRRSIAFSPAPTKTASVLEKRAKPAGFVGAMVQTFFGGSSDDYDSPTLQHTYFRGFGLNINS